jgi:5-formyltetrahydrofolate cyclo-ligase
LATDALIRALLRAGCHVYAPAVTHNHRMRFVPLSDSGRLRRDSLGLPRPARTRPQRSPRRLDLVIVPMVGFDARAHRLGAGGGYYDRSFSFRHGASGRPRLIGLAFEAQRVEQVPTEAWDLRLDAVVTERRVYRHRS